MRYHLLFSLVFFPLSLLFDDHPSQHHHQKQTHEEEELKKIHSHYVSLSLFSLRGQPATTKILISFLKPSHTHTLSTPDSWPAKTQTLLQNSRTWSQATLWPAEATQQQQRRWRREGSNQAQGIPKPSLFLDSSKKPTVTDFCSLPIGADFCSWRPWK